MQTIKFPKVGTGSAALDGLVAAVLVVVAVLGLVFLLVGPPRAATSSLPRSATKGRVVPRTSVPQVEPIAFKAIPVADARAFNAAIPFSTAPNPAARPFRFAGSAEDRLRALDCLAAAVLYEAGDDPVGQRAVAQVVLNRVRHPAFPRTVCGVVFQGSERRTGCQFTFTCDGALARSYSEPSWQRARRIADAALSGSVYKPVGHATHYHTDWVVPYWSSSLDKIVAVDTHLFFRWTGWWGTPPAFRFQATGIEPHIPGLALRFPEHASITAVAAGAEVPSGPVPVAITNNLPAPTAENANAFQVFLSENDVAGFPAIAAFTCGARPRCKFMGWTDPAKVPRGGKPTSEQLAAASFSYLRDRSINLERALWNCAQFKRPAGQCMWSKSPPPEPKASALPAANLPQGPVKLDGVRFKANAEAGAKP